MSNKGSSKSAQPGAGAAMVLLAGRAPALLAPHAQPGQYPGPPYQHGGGQVLLPDGDHGAAALGVPQHARLVGKGGHGVACRCGSLRVQRPDPGAQPLTAARCQLAAALTAVWISKRFDRSLKKRGLAQPTTTWGPGARGERDSGFSGERVCSASNRRTAGSSRRRTHGTHSPLPAPHKCTPTLGHPHPVSHPPRQTAPASRRCAPPPCAR